MTNEMAAAVAQRGATRREPPWAGFLRSLHTPPPESILPAGVALVLGLITLGTKAWWWDEGLDVSLARDPWIKLVGKAGYHEPSQALYLVLFKIWRAFTPQTEFFTRLPSVLLAAAAAALVAFLGARLFDRLTGLLAGIFLATNAQVVSLSQQTRTYALAELASIAVTISFLHAMRSERQRPWLVYGAVGALGAYAHFFVGFVLAAHASLLPRMTAPQRRLLVKAWTIVAVAFLPALPFVTNGSGHASIAPTSWRSLYRALSALSGYNGVLLAAVVVGAVVLLRDLASNTASTRNLLFAWATMPVAGALVVSVYTPVLIGRYLVVAAPSLALIAAVGVRAIRPRFAAVALAAAVIAVAAKQTVSWYVAVPEDWRGAARYAAQQERLGATVTLIPGAPVSYQLYAPLPKECHHVPGHFDLRCNYQAEGRTTLVVTFQPQYWRGLPGAQHYRLVNRRWFGRRLVVLELVRKQVARIATTAEP
jgi:4-amino-4-deoxy-L-arabinose transferase-like glycosyltransferase